MSTMTMTPNDQMRNRKKMKYINKAKNVAQNASKPFIDKAKEKAVDYTLKRIKEHFGFEIISVTRRLGARNEEIISGHLEELRMRFEKPKTPRYAEDRGIVPMMQSNVEKIFKVDIGTYIYIRTNRECAKMYNDSDVFSETSKFNLYMYIFGKKAYTYFKEFNALIEKNDSDEYHMTYKISGDNSREDDSFRSVGSEMNLRSLDTLFYTEGVKETIVTHIDKFLESEPVYDKRGLIFKTGLLLYGEPGTGKSSLCNAIASHYGMDLILIDMTTFGKLDTATLTNSINVDDKRYAIVLEDIDCVILDRENKNTDKEDKAVVNKLLQFLDSNSSPSNVVFIATTNHLELLDPALRRKGRFDLAIEVGPIDKAGAIKMCESFELEESDIKEIIKNVESFPINQSTLQSMILEKIKININGEIDQEALDFDPVQVALDISAKALTDKIDEEIAKDLEPEAAKPKKAASKKKTATVVTKESDEEKPKKAAAKKATTAKKRGPKKQDEKAIDEIIENL